MPRATVIRLAVTACIVALVAPLPMSRTYVTVTWYWAINWDHGFVRRGLCGEIAQLVAPGDLSSGAQTMSGLAAVAGGCLFMAVGVWLVARLDPVSVGVGLTLLLSPMGLLMQWNDPRPESFGYLAFVPLAAALCTKGRARDGLVLAAGVLLAVVALMSENVVFAIGPWAVLLVLASTDAQRRSEAARILALLLALPAVAVAVVLVFGRADAGQVAALREGSRGFSRSASQHMHFIGDSYATNVHYVLTHHLRLSFETLATTLVAVAIASVAAGAAGYLYVVRRVPRDRWIVGAAALPVVALVIEAVAGVDWPRWVGQQASGAILAIAVLLLIRPLPSPPSWQAARLAALVPVLLVMALIPQVPYTMTQHHAVDYWFSRVGFL